MTQKLRERLNKGGNKLMDVRQQQLMEWAHQQLLESGLAEQQPEPLTTVSGDASFRRYFRCAFQSPNGQATTVIAVDAPPEKEDNHSFIRVAETLGNRGVNVPQVLAKDYDQGFMLLSDFGDVLLRDVLDETCCDKLYTQALYDLLRLQKADFTPELPRYDSALLQREMMLFQDWFLGEHLGLALNEDELALLSETFALLEASALEQPMVTVHRDYHSRNIMHVKDQPLGIIDFQDAVFGPFTYDAVSLLRDCYINWPEEKVRAWALDFKNHFDQQELCEAVPASQFFYWFDLMGTQRHLKAIGIFSRLNYRDGKSGYLKDIPRTLNYVLNEIEPYAAFEKFRGFLRERVVPAFLEKQPEARAHLNGAL